MAKRSISIIQQSQNRINSENEKMGGNRDRSQVEELEQKILDADRNLLAIRREHCSDPEKPIRIDFVQSLQGSDHKKARHCIKQIQEYKARINALDERTGFVGETFRDDSGDAKIETDRECIVQMRQKLIKLREANISP